MATRIVSIQWLRALAALLVLAQHVAASIGDGGAPVTEALHPNVRHLALMGASGVDLFFVISGMVMAQTLATRDITPTAFLVARWRRIVPLFVMVSAVYMALSPTPAVLPALVSTITILPVLDGEAYHAPVLTVGWTLGFEFSFYALVALVIAVAGRSPLRLAALAFGAAMTGSLLHPAWAPLRMMLNPLQAEFAMGVIGWYVWQRGWLRACGLPLVLAGIAGLALAAGRADLYCLAFFENAVNGISGWSRVMSWGLPWALIVTALLGRRSSGRTSDAVAALGDASYALYLIHPCVVLAVERLHGTLTLAPGAYATAIIVPSVGLALAFHRWVERPLLAANRQASRRVQQPAPA
ncbi:peptidoglycan/LPS O-acetylase OafA/YrhL [Sphingomonas jinjuensis]|uniref:Peptidoglycan/LPS O-acetylase OafA/YrhL n=1 Tax=Sphingomonas jinjuensis TaxID=535907 RepID=A0A840FEK0_9SPHN|nr:peptidoglycan/LPS O-acetylase OafA/YrhL [Sphingomonas jinjuensis]